MSENYKIQKIGVAALCRISAKGGEGVYLYIPKNFAEVYGIVGADHAEVYFRCIFTKVAELPSEQVSQKIEDLTGRNKQSKDNDFTKGEI